MSEARFPRAKMAVQPTLSPLNLMVAVATTLLLFTTVMMVDVQGFVSPNSLATKRYRSAVRLPVAVASSVEESSSMSIPGSGSQDDGSENEVSTGSSGGSQAEYGVSLPLPDTYVRCSKCQAHFALRPEDLGDRGKGRRVECSLCKHSWFQARDKLMEIRDGFELQPFDDHQTSLIEDNLKAGRAANFAGEAKIYVGNLDFACEEADLVEAFQECGDVGEVSLVRDHATGRSRGFAFVTMMTKEGGDNAIEQMDGKELMGRNLTVKRPNN